MLHRSSTSGKWCVPESTVTSSREMYALVNKRSSTRIPEYMLTDELRALLAPHYEDHPWLYWSNMQAASWR
jgi:hypothetical protein